MLIKALKFIGFYLLAVGLSAVVFLPHLQLMLTTSRISTPSSLFQTIQFRDLFRYVTGFVQPIVDRNDFNPLVSKYVVRSFGHGGGAPVFSFILTPLIIFQLFDLSRDRFHRLVILVTYAALIALAIFPNLYFLVQGNNDTRWMVMFVLLNMYTVSYFLDDFKRINRPLLLFGGLVLLIVVVGTYYYSRQNGLHIEEVYYDIAKRNILILGAFTLVYLVVLQYFTSARWSVALMALILVGESYLSLYNMFFNPVPSISMSWQELESNDLGNDRFFRNLEALDDGVYRIDVLENYGFNNPMSKNYLGFTFYSSVYNFEVDDFIQNNIASAGGWVVTANQGKWEHKLMFSGKYFVDFNGGIQVPFGYTFFETIGDGLNQHRVYRNQYHVPFMYTQQATLNYEVWRSLSGLEKMRALMHYVVLYDSEQIQYEPGQSLTFLGQFGTVFEESFEAPIRNVVVYATLPRSEEVQFFFYLDETLIQSFYSYEPHYSSVHITEPFNKLRIEVTNLYGVPDEEFINEAYIDQPSSYMLEWYTQKRSGFVQDFVLGRDAFSGWLYADQAQWAVTSIAYDRHWEISVNGQPVDVHKVNGGFLGFEIGPGRNDIVAKYVPRNVHLGAGISLISLLALLLYVKRSSWIKR